ncbi:thioesterase family protein-like protein [Aulographum hederae CBS 113979]|uniref:Thioesterase family protein-like protein n=1 Tax=Aulographum hederae CBS 113979 TaxID=1176131 RepID=A0A6G1GM58_9PEZI|nr:thioesterase family protein-like protein [Aulographum hederae CBS 113979]
MASKEEARVKAMAAVQSIFDKYFLLAARRPHDHVDYDYETMRQLKLVDAGPEGSVLFEMTIGKNFSNLNDVMHGGAAGVIFDMSTTTALGPLSRPGFYYFLGGVTRTLNISYLRAVPTGTTVRLRSWVTSVGRTMAMIRGEMTSVDGKLVYCTAEHHKVNLDPKPEHAAVKTKWEDELEAEIARTAREKVEKKRRAEKL